MISLMLFGSSILFDRDELGRGEARRENMRREERRDKGGGGRWDEKRRDAMREMGKGITFREKDT